MALISLAAGSGRLRNAVDDQPWRRVAVFGDAMVTPAISVLSAIAVLQRRLPRGQRWVPRGRTYLRLISKRVSAQVYVVKRPRPCTHFYDPPYTILSDG